MAASGNDNEDGGGGGGGCCYKARLIGSVKKEVKQVMEESVTKKFVHQESGSVTALCGAVEACLSQGLRRRALGLFKTSSTTALLHKIAKHNAEAAIVSRKVSESESNDPCNKRSTSSSSDSTSKPIALIKNASLQNVNVSQQQQQQQLPKYLWIRIALFEKQLANIIDYLVSNARKYYEKDALVADPDYGNILSSLLVGPCALDYTRTKTSDHFWTDPPADELVQRHRISSGGHSTPSPAVCRPIPNFRRSLNASCDEPISRFQSGHQQQQQQPHQQQQQQQFLAAKDYVESLHQNSRTTLLFGKNNVTVLPAEAPHLNDPIPGYLSLHQTANSLTIKWTPNQLMNGFAADNTEMQQQQQDNKSVYWDYALQVRLDEIVYVHCHQDADVEGTIVLVGQDGIQRPPIHFPKGGHMLAFLSCLETGLLPHGRLDPPLWSQRRRASTVTNCKRKRPLPVLAENEDEPRDYVFRIIDNSIDPKEILSRHELMERNATPTTTPFPNKIRVQLGSSTSTSSSSSMKSFSIDQNGSESSPNVCIQAVCDSMKRQIISRAFYGWLAYCRHLSTVRTHLSGLVNDQIVSGDDAERGVTAEEWAELHRGDRLEDRERVFRLAYYGGVAHELRKQVWPYLLGHYRFASTLPERNELCERTKQAYENTMSEWLAVEAIVRQRDKETQANAIAKLSSSSTATGDQAPPPSSPIRKELSNDVFEDDADSVTECEQGNTYDNGPLPPDGRKFGGNVIVTNPSVDTANDYRSQRCVSVDLSSEDIGDGRQQQQQQQRTLLDTFECIESYGSISPARSACVSPASSNGGVYTTELLETFGLNLHRIEKDVQRCDRNYRYFSGGDNLDKLRNVMCTYVWEHLDIGYMQGMCDLVAPLLVVFDDESLTYACFSHLMERMVENFPNGNAMDAHFANMRSLIQILDAEMYELMHTHGDYTHFYFCYRWFLLDFKRELIYDDVFAFWETIWAARHVSSAHFVLFLALALLETYRDIILSNGMDFTDIIKFFNEMAERHDARAVLRLARELVLQLQLLIENKE